MNVEYETYLRSDHWKQFRTDYYRFHVRACILCYSESQLNLHHRYYSVDGQSILGAERYEDVCVLCDRCHRELHKRKVEEHLQSRHYRKRNNLERLRQLLGLTVVHRSAGLAEIKERQGSDRRKKKREGVKLSRAQKKSIHQTKHLKGRHGRAITPQWIDQPKAEPSRAIEPHIQSTHKMRQSKAYKAQKPAWEELSRREDMAQADLDEAAYHQFTQAMRRD